MENDKFPLLTFFNSWSVRICGLTFYLSKMNHNAAYYAKKLSLQKHPEGGWFKEVYRSTEMIEPKGLPERFLGQRNISTAIYYMLESHEFSAFHRIKSDEMWHFYCGAPLHVFRIDPSGKLEIIKLGNNLENGEVFQAWVPAGDWFASKSVGKDGFTLVGCTVAPGFDFADFELAERDKLSKKFPQHQGLITELTKG